MKIYVYVEGGKESARDSQASITISKGNGGLPTVLQASEVKVVSKDELEAVLSARIITATASGVVTPKERKVEEDSTAAGSKV